MQKRILVVDDEPNIRKVLRAHLRRGGYLVEEAEDGRQALAWLNQEAFDLVISDLRMPGLDGMSLLARCREDFPGLPVILITAHGTVDSAVEAIKLGAHDYITKPFDQDELQKVILGAIRVEERGRAKFVGAAKDRGQHGMIGSSAAMRQVFDLISRVAASPTTVLVTGESGTGKELVARALHDASGRREGPFVQVNCGAIPEALFESELFGHERGAFTGAVSARPGRFELAHGGTLFLDEVGELPRDMQVKLLRVLQDRTFDRVGGIRPQTVDVRVVAATNRDLQKDVVAGVFREDLFYRLNVVPIKLPPLRDRPEDIPPLVEYFVERFNKRLGRSVRSVRAEAMAALCAAPWRGNIRELENVLERAVLLAAGATLGVDDLLGFTAEPGQAAEPEEVGGLGLKEYVRVYTARIERARIQKALTDANGNVTHASKRLEISRKSLQMKMKEYGLREEREGEPDDA
jgi:two-component system response regulator AtoC